MYRIIFSILLCCASLQLFAQARIGFSAAAIRQEFSQDYKLESGTNDNGVYHISMDMNFAYVVYFFDDNYICTTTLILPANRKVLNNYVQLHNEEYVTISSTQWKMYTENGICDIELVMDGEYSFFRWTEAN